MYVNDCEGWLYTLFVLVEDEEMQKDKRSAAKSKQKIFSCRRSHYQSNDSYYCVFTAT